MCRMRCIRPLVALALAGCAAPVAIHRQDVVLGEVAAHYRAFYPADGDPDLGDDAGLLRPRFGLPAIARAGDGFAVELLERGAAPATIRAALLRPAVTNADAERCLAGATVDGCHPLALAPSEPPPLADAPALGDLRLTDARVAWLSAQPLDEPPPGGYDLYVHPPCDGATRAPHAVWLRADDPALLREVRVAHLSDIHIGKHRDELEDHLRRVIDEVNAAQPDLVIITGDIVNQGTDPSLPPRARALLLGLDAPVAIVIGNHDIGFRSFVGDHYGVGWQNFARVFHPFLEFELQLGGFTFVGFDSGPSTLSPRVLTRGLAPATVAHLGELMSAAAGGRGVVLFSHAPSRAVLAGDDPGASGGAFGHMRDGHNEFERLLLDAAARGQRVLHLAGHTHWSDLFEARDDGNGLHFVRWPDGTLPIEPTAIHARAAMVTTQAATHSGPWPKTSARGYGFTLLELGDGDARVAFHRHDGDVPPEAMIAGSGSSPRARH
jgi:hypothetical protein